MPKDLARGSSQPKPSRRSAECERGHLLSSQNQCKPDIPPALVFQHPAIKERYKKLKSSEQSLIQTVQLLLRVGLMQNSTQELGLEISTAFDFHISPNTTPVLKSFRSQFFIPLSPACSPMLEGTARAHMCTLGWPDAANTFNSFQYTQLWGFLSHMPTAESPTAALSLKTAK